MLRFRQIFEIQIFFIPQEYISISQYFRYGIIFKLQNSISI